MSRPRVSHFLETERFPVTPADPVWRAPLPCGRPQAVCGPEPGAAPTVGDYFQALEAFCTGEGAAVLSRLHRRGAVGEVPLEEIRVFLAKHGAAYHPARLETRGGGVRHEWVANVAFSAEGRRLIRRETAILARLNAATRLPYLPEVYGAFSLEPRSGPRFDLWLGQWFSGFCEFHLHRGGPGEPPRLRLWDPAAGSCDLTPGAAKAIYREAARILTLYLDLERFEEIALWHHAAGDFVACSGPEGVAVRLIAVREYRPLFGGAAAAGPDDGVAARLTRLLLFFLALSLHTRLDRLEGTGEFALAPEEAVFATREGVLAALAEKAEGFPLAEAFAALLSSCGEKDFLELCSGIVARRYPEGSPERRLLAGALPAHAAALGACARSV